MSVVLFGRPCPGCGMTTSICSLVHGHFIDAFRAHPFGPPMYALYTASAIAAIWSWAKRVRMDTGTKLMNTSLIALIVAFMAFGAIRFATTTGYQWSYEPQGIRTARLR